MSESDSASGVEACQGVSDARGTGDGKADGLEPVLPLDLSRVRTVRDLVEQMRDTSFGARRVGEAADLLHHMASDEDCFVVLTLTGAMTVAKLGLIICDMIDQGLIHAVVATGALMAHGMVEGAGLSHFKVPDDYRDADLFERGYHRVYDTLETEGNFLETEDLLTEALASHDPAIPLSSAAICQALGRELAARAPGRAVLVSALDRGVPIYIPAFTDSVLGLDFQVLNLQRRREGLAPFVYDAFLDLDDFAAHIRPQRTTGIFTIGGGVPRNWAQQVSPYLDYVSTRLEGRPGFKPYQYGLRICPDPVHLGHLSGCTYSESVSWGKFVPRKDGGRWVEVLADATIAWPMVTKAALERLEDDGLLPVRKDLPAPEPLD